MGVTMKRNILVYALLIFAECLGITLTGIGYHWNNLALKIVGIICIVVSLIAFAMYVAEYKVNSTCDKLFSEKNFEDEREFIEKKMKSPFFFLMRLVAIRHYIRVCMALDDLQTAFRYIARLRHGGGKAWKYATAYSYILIKLDEGDIKTARREFEDFRKDCAHAEIYKTQLEILTAIFSRLLSTRNVKPLPEAAVESSFPVVSRVLGRHYESQAAKEDWN